MQRRVSANGNHDTYYVYDNRGNLRFVLPPCLQDEGISQDKLDALAYRYEYDSRDRCVSKKLPGCDAVRYVYDKADRLIFTQDGNQRGKKQWLFSIPDAFGRVVLSGICSAIFPVDVDAVEAEFTGNGIYQGYVVKAGTTIRELSVISLLSVNYYDSYDFLGKNGFPAYTYDNSLTSSGDGARSEARGLLTGSVTYLTGGGTGLLYSVLYYDSRSRLIQRQRSNLLGGKDTESTSYNFTGQPTQWRHLHTASGKPTRSEVCTYAYDPTGRLLTLKHQSGALGEVPLAVYTYDNLGRLQSKSLHGSAANRLTYAYNVRGWLTGISGSKFTQNLYYNTGNGTAKYNGSISSMTWKAGDESTLRGYKFTYDGLDRLLNATYGETAAINANTNRFSENVTAYDKNGNINSLQRYGQTSASAYGLVDNLTFTLDGNRLNRVDDAVAASAYNGSFEFKDAVKQANEYAYDANGNLTKDLNKGISNISYNCLNLPSVVTFSDGSTITYTYAADGTKLKTVHKIGGTTTTTDYCGNVIYENGVQKLLLTEEGYVTLDDNKYHYYLKDHQGNNRVVINQSGSVEETNHYYPFGGVFAGSNSVQPYKYNGKELDAKKGLNWYDYGARHYDAALGRFTTVDPLAEKYYSTSLFAYCLNNPLKYVDYDGRKPRIYVETKGFGHVFVTTGNGQNTTVYTYGRYGDINWNKSSSAGSARNGEGVLIIMKGKEALEYIKNEITKMEARVYEVPSGNDEKVDKHFRNLFDSSDKKPSKKRYRNAENARVVDEYDLLDNNCTTKSLEAISVGTNGNFGIESTSPSNLDTQLHYENKKDGSRIRKVTYNELYEEYLK
ncbi:MAG: hypothetical protein BACD_01120 [Bacteroides rodentium]